MCQPLEGRNYFQEYFEGPKALSQIPAPSSVTYRSDLNPIAREQDSHLAGAYHTAHSSPSLDRWRQGGFTARWGQERDSSALA